MRDFEEYKNEIESLAYNMGLECEKADHSVADFIIRKGECKYLIGRVFDSEKRRNYGECFFIPEFLPEEWVSYCIISEIFWFLPSFGRFNTPRNLIEHIVECEQHKEERAKEAMTKKMKSAFLGINY